MKNAWKHAASKRLVEPRVGVAPRNENTLAKPAVLFPLNGNAMRRVLGAKAEPRRHQARPQLLEANHAYAANTVAAIELGLEWWREHTLERQRVNVVIQQNPPVDNPVDGVEKHTTVMTAW